MNAFYFNPTPTVTLILSCISAGNILDGKTQTVYTTSDKTTHFMSPIGSLQLTAEECNEILMKRAVAAVQANNQHTITTSQASEGHNARKFRHYQCDKSTN